MTKDQETFNTVATHLLKQDERCKPNGSKTGCAYRNERGLKCAVGILIPDDEYNPSIEGEYVKDLKLKCLEGISLPLLIELQTIHDGSTTKYWYQDLCTVANQFSLEMVERVSQC